MDPEAPGPGRRWWTPPARVRAFIGRYETLLWWLHSLYVLGLGAVVLWLGARHYAWLRYSAFYLVFIWISSLFLAEVVHRREGVWWSRVRLVVNYINKNFYQQLLFFLLPIYYASASAWSANLIFVALLAASALLSTFDVFFDQHLSVRRGLTAVFFAFSLFACINVMLPVLWSISNRVALLVSLLLAVVAFATIRYSGGALTRRGRRSQIGIAAIALVLLVALGRPLIPPAPLRVLQTEFGTGINRAAFQVIGPVASLRVGWTGRVYGVTSIYAPLGLRDRVGHRWYQDGRLVYASPFYRLEGGRPEGFRLWTSASVANVRRGTRLTVEVWTEAGQLVGRAGIRGE